MRRAVGIGLMLLQVGCLLGEPFACAQDEQCVRPGRDGGICLDGWCAYEDESCSSELRYSENAESGLAGTCVDSDETDDDDGDDSEDAITASSTSAGCPGGCADPPGECWEPEGACDAGACVYVEAAARTPCGASELCSTWACDGAGACVLESEVECNDPPRCYSVGGVCDPATGYCNYEPHSKGVGCSDDYACTVGDECDGTGGCIPGQLCPPSGPCVASNCVDGECVEDDLADGVLCGPQEASRCCSGSCRDVSSDEANCGGCGMACVVGESCESVSVTATCSSAPSQTSGRCTCSGSNADCPGGQVCRTDAPFPDYCAPESPSDCSDGASLVELSGCPNYCAY